MRRLFTAAESGLTSNALRWGEQTGRWVRVQKGVYADGPEPPSPLDRERARVLAAEEAARGGLAGVLLGLDSVELDGMPIRKGRLVDARTTIIGGVACVSALQALVDLAAHIDDDTWEQALESALRKRLVSLGAFAGLPANVQGVRRIRRVLATRGDVPPTESLLETLTVQLIRSVPALPEPVRQHRVTWSDGSFVARVDLCWPHLGVFIELDGQGHKDQPVYDAHRQTAVVAATGWLVARFTWREVTRAPTMCVRRLLAIVERLAA
ncbi:MAG TPA: DUF559 domain-containing protein [Acidimicrobiales bacterium]|nr:DUF559 domain-containing protein [Acidimicrobiales bacterium]